MSTPIKFGLVAAVIIAIVAAGYYMAKKKAAKAGKPINSPMDALDSVVASIKGKAQPDDRFARDKQGNVDYTRQADGTPIMFT